MNWRCWLRHDWRPWAAFYPAWVLKTFQKPQEWHRSCRRCAAMQIRVKRPWGAPKHKQERPHFV